MLPCGPFRQARYGSSESRISDRKILGKGRTCGKSKARFSYRKGKRGPDVPPTSMPSLRAYAARSHRKKRIILPMRKLTDNVAPRPAMIMNAAKLLSMSRFAAGPTIKPEPQITPQIVSGPIRPATAENMYNARELSADMLGAVARDRANPTALKPKRIAMTPIPRINPLVPCSNPCPPEAFQSHVAAIQSIAAVQGSSQLMRVAYVLLAHAGSAGSSLRASSGGRQSTRSGDASGAPHNQST